MSNHHKTTKTFILTNEITGKEIRFPREKCGLHTAPIEQGERLLIEPQDSFSEGAPSKGAVALLSTVEENKQLYTKRQIAAAEKAKELYQVINYPSMRDFKNMIQLNQIKNCPITIEDVKLYEKIFGPDIYALKGKTVRHKPKVVINDYIEIPRALIQAHQGIILFADNMFIDGVMLLVSLSKHIKLGTSTYLPDKNKNTLLWTLEDIVLHYNKAGFYIKELHADPEFNCVKPDIEKKRNHL